MIIAVEFDGVIAKSTSDFDDTDSSLHFIVGAKKGLQSLKAADHILLLYSERANRALRIDPQLDPLVRAGVLKIDKNQWKASAKIHDARYRQMVSFVASYLPRLFDAIDDGQQGKPAADLFIEARAFYDGREMSWDKITRMYGA